LTRTDWDRFPLLLSRSQLGMIGLTEKDIRCLVALKKLTPWRSRGKKGYAKYRKTEVAEILKLEV